MSRRLFLGFALFFGALWVLACLWALWTVPNWLAVKFVFTLLIPTWLCLGGWAWAE